MAPGHLLWICPCQVLRDESSEPFVSFIDAILFHASKAPSNPAIGLENGVLTYGQLADAIFSATARCEKAGLRPGSLVGLIVADPVWHICLIAALYRLGVASVSIAAEEVAIFSDGDLVAVLHDGPKSQDSRRRAMLIEPDWFTLRSPVVRNVESAFRAQDLCRIALSSGTTGQPKPIAFSSDTIWHRLVTYSFRGGFASSERYFAARNCVPSSALPSHFLR